LAALLPAAARALGERLRIMAEDDGLAVVVKPQGCPTMGKGSLARADWLLRQLRPSTADDALSLPRPVHRLDAGTGGLLVLAKTAAALRSCSASFSRGLVRKRYRALVHGHFAMGQEGRCDEPLYGKPCTTRLRAAEPPVRSGGRWVSTLDLWPVSGRRHQLRRHLKLLGCPILGDTRYGGSRRPGSCEEEALGPGSASDSEGADGALCADDLLAAVQEPHLCLWSLEISLPHPNAGPGDEHGDERRLVVVLEEPPAFAAIRHEAVARSEAGSSALEPAMERALAGGAGYACGGVSPPERSDAD